MDSGWRSRRRHTESPPARPRFSTTTAWSSGRACCDGRPDRPHDSSRRGLRERRPARPCGGRSPAQLHLRGRGRSRHRPRDTARAARGGGRADRRAGGRRGHGQGRAWPVRRRWTAGRARTARRRRRPAARAGDSRRPFRRGPARRRELGRAREARRGRRKARSDVTEKSDKALLRRYHEEGDLAAREQLIEQYMSLVRSLARRYSYRGEQFEDLVQIGAIGLIKAIDRFDLERGVELTTYATPNIIGEIKRHFRDRGWSVRVPRGLQELNIQLSRLLEEKTVEFGRSPTIAQQVGISQLHVARLIRRSLEKIREEIAADEEAGRALR